MLRREQTIGANFSFQHHPFACLLKPLQRTESNIVNNADELFAFWREIDADNVDVVLDLVAMATAKDTVGGYVARFGERLSHVHIVDGTPSGHLAWGDGNLPLHGYLAEFGANSFTGTQTFEAFGNGSYALGPVLACQRCLKAIAPLLDHAEQ